jgi:hypothetical protein
MEGRRVLSISGSARGGGAAEPWAHLGGVLVLYAVVSFFVLDLDRVSVADDSLMYHLPVFAYFAGAVRHGLGLPLWYPDFGGTPVGVSAIPLFPFIPYRLAGYISVGMTGMSVALAYRLTLMLGMGAMAAGWWHCLRRISGSHWGATAGVLMVLLGGTGTAVYHEEQVLATVFFVPFILLALMEAARDVRYLAVAAVLLGCALGVHYPHIHLFAAASLVVVYGVFRSEWRRAARAALGRPAVLGLAALLFLISLGPLLYASSEMGAFASPVREAGSIGAGSIAEYIELNEKQISSAPAVYFLRYVAPGLDVNADSALFFVTLTGMALVLLGIALRPRESAPLVVLAALLAYAASGIYGGLPSVLFRMHFPYIEFFRQWYHFGAYLNLVLSALGAVGMAALGARLRGLRVSAAVMAGVIVFIAVEGGMFLASYRDRHLSSAPSSALRVDGARYREMLRDEGVMAGIPSAIAGAGGLPLMVYRERGRLPRRCFGMAALPVVVATTLITDADIPEGARMDLVSEFCEAGATGSAVIATIPRGETPVSAMTPAEWRDSGSEPFAGDLREVPRDGLSVTPRGLSVRADAPGPGLLVVPYAYRLGLQASVGGMTVRTYPVFAGAMTGVIVPAGGATVAFNVLVPWYMYALGIQYLALAGVCVFAYRVRPRGGDVSV